MAPLVVPARLGLIVIALGAIACRENPPAPPARETGPAKEGLRPLTSRDEGAGAASPSPDTTSMQAPLPPGHPPVSGGGRAAAPAADPAASLAGAITLGPGMEARMGSASVLYVIARSTKTGGVVAVRREEGIRFPHSFQVSSADVMMEGTAFTGPFDVVARVSQTGDAIPGPGDLEGTAKGVSLGSRGIKVTIDTVRQ